MTIVKRSNRNPLSTSSFKTLTNYILDTKNNGKKLDYVSISNCLTSDQYFAIKEIEATQSLNQRTIYDKTFHMNNPFQDYFKLSKAIKTPEQKHGFEVDNHIYLGQYTTCSPLSAT
ncbi:MAG: hypothetical protein HRT90_04710 [Candidatus Margulisbacteria bacterium]|nr:hypothetical protein [Candidatus Margulisiibacteriota bacterium]